MNPVIIGNATLYLGDALAVLRTLPAESVHCCVTSPPYWGLRDYGTAKWEGGDPACSHEPPQEWIDHNFNANSGFGNGAKTQSAAAKGRWYNADGSCKCGAKRIDAQLGLEPTPAEYVEKMVGVFREVRRVLRDDGTLWLNLGDSYTGGGRGGGAEGSKQQTNVGSLADLLTADAFRRGSGRADGLVTNELPRNRDGVGPVAGLPSKNLVGIPWRVAFALQADGWYLRQDIIWAKPNPMPESVRDRCTKSHESIFLLAKNERYYFDADAIAEQAVYDGPPRCAESFMRKVVESGPPGQPPQHREDREDISYSGTRNKRSVWTVATQPYAEAHFATFPPKLIEPCILAGCPAGGTVLDPFNGSGTTGLVALQDGRQYIGIELNPDYIELSAPRIENAQRQERLFA